MHQEHRMSDLDAQTVDSAQPKAAVSRETTGDNFISNLVFNTCGAATATDNSSTVTFASDHINSELSLTASLLVKADTDIIV